MGIQTQCEEEIFARHDVVDVILGPGQMLAAAAIRCVCSRKSAGSVHQTRILYFEAKVFAHTLNLTCIRRPPISDPLHSHPFWPIPFVHRPGFVLPAKHCRYAGRVNGRTTSRVSNPGLIAFHERSRAWHAGVLFERDEGEEAEQGSRGVCHAVFEGTVE